MKRVFLPIIFLALLLPSSMAFAGIEVTPGVKRIGEGLTHGAHFVGEVVKEVGKEGCEALEKGLPNGGGC